MKIVYMTFTLVVSEGLEGEGGGDGAAKHAGTATNDTVARLAMPLMP